MACLLLAAACSRKEGKHYLERVEVEGETAADNGVMALTREQVRELLVEKLGAHGAFVLGPGKEPPDGVQPTRATLVLEFTREAQKEGREGTYAEVGATLSLRPRGAAGPRYEVVGLGEVRIEGEAPGERQEAVQEALSLAIAQVVEAAHLQLTAARKPDAQLVKDLSAGDPRVREFAIRVLSDRRNPAVSDTLLGRLESSEPDEVRRAIGALVEMREPRAVPAMIDLGRAKDAMFLREIVFALSQIGGDEAEAYLYTIAQGHDQAVIRDAAEQALRELTTRKARAKDARSEKPSGRNREAPP